MSAGVLTFSVDLDYINVDSIQPYVSFLQSLIDKEIEKENLKAQKKSSRKPFTQLREILEETEVETQVENASLEGSEDRDLSKMTKAEISALCKAKDIKFTTKTSKDDLIKLLSV
jgi:hypothetical protein